MEKMHSFPETRQQMRSRWKRQDAERQAQYERVKRFVSTLAPERERTFRVSLTEAHTFRVNYEVAAWYRNVRCEPQEHILTAYYGLGRWHWSFSLTGAVVGAYLGALFGGVPVGPDRTGPGEIGTRGEWSKTWDAFTLEHFIMCGGDIGHVKGESPLRVERLA